MPVDPIEQELDQRAEEYVLGAWDRMREHESAMLILIRNEEDKLMLEEIWLKQFYRGEALAALRRLREAAR